MGNPCNNALTQSELNSCSAENAKRADAVMNDLYKKVRSSMAKELNESTDDFSRKKLAAGLAKLKVAQNAWLNYRDLHCGAAAAETWGGSMQPMVTAQCVTETTKHRIAEIKSAYGPLIRGQK